MSKRQGVVRRDESSIIPYHFRTTTVRNVRYGRCQRNLAVRVGGNVVDGCRGFIASGAEGTAAALTCAFCGCHRSFHKMEEFIEVVGENSPPPPPTTSGA